MIKSGLEFILKLTEPLQSYCCPVQKYLPRMAELAWQLSRYLWRGSVNFKINSRPLFTIISKLKNDNFKTRNFSSSWCQVWHCYCGIPLRPVNWKYHWDISQYLTFLKRLKSRKWTTSHNYLGKDQTKITQEIRYTLILFFIVLAWIYVVAL